MRKFIFCFLACVLCAQGAFANEVVDGYFNKRGDFIIVDYDLTPANSWRSNYSNPPAKIVDNSGFNRHRIASAGGFFGPYGGSLHGLNGHTTYGMSFYGVQ